MNKRFRTGGALVLAVLGSATAHAQTYKATPVWADEFDGTAVNTSNWSFDTGNNGGWGNHEWENYQQANATVGGGVLAITARKEYLNGSWQYTSARMKTRNLQDFRFGKVEARIKMPLGRGLWPGFWMLGSNETAARPWPLCGEIDIMEHVNADNVTHATEHWDNGGHVQYGTTGTIQAPTDGYHTYTLTWDTNYIHTFVDGVGYHDFKIAGGVGSTEEFQKRFYILLNLAVGGDFPNVTSIDESKLPGTMYVDYVRVYEESAAPVVNPAVVLEAENANAAHGMLAEACQDAGGGENMGNINAGDYLKFNVNFPAPGSYVVEYRVASGAAGGTISCDLNGGATQLGSTTVPGTGNWQTWTTVSKVVTVPAAGTYDFGVYAQTGGYNLNWVRISRGSVLLQAENANVNSGMVVESCTDAGGGQDMGYIDAGDFLKFNQVVFPTSGNYVIEYRVASGGGGGTISSDLSAGAIQLGSTTVPGTGNWQNWTTVSRTVYVNAGTYDFGVYAQTGGYNLNWIRISKAPNGARTALARATPGEPAALVLYPNPATDRLTLDAPASLLGATLRITDLAGRTVWQGTHTGAALDVAALRPGLYTLVVAGPSQPVLVRRFSKQ
ncbi:carbohydrate-binding protein [Hymenobacter sp. UYCo722]|uniref:carbohydrate-binding protein n=1 Tax=Hymenobacter sp. UYCo722 TaxID=3156335 RepID=UPI003399C7E5